MDDPSPLLKRLPPVNDCKSESVLLDFMCYYAALHQKFKGTPVNETITEIANRISEGSGPFEDIQSSIKEELASIVARGRECYCKLIVPFAKSGGKTNEFVVAVANSFELFSRRTIQLWYSSDDASVFYTVQRVIHNEIVQNRRDPILCTRLCKLIIEAMALHYHQAPFAQLNQRQRSDASHPVVRQMFWAASFLYSTMDKKWDLARDHTAWLNSVIDTNVGSLRSELFQVTLQCVQRVEQKKSCISRLRQIARAEEDKEEKGFIKKFIKDFSAVEVGKIRQTEEADLAWQTALADATKLIDVFNLQSLFDDEEIQIEPDTTPPKQEEIVVVNTLNAEERERLDRQINGLDPSYDQDSENPIYICDGFIYQDIQENKKEDYTADEEAKKLKKQNEEEIEKLSAELTEAEIDRLTTELTTELAKEIATETIKEEDELRKAQETVLSKRSSLPMAFYQQLVAFVLPDLESVLEPTIECFLCYCDLDFSDYRRIRFLTCCAGGTFSCWDCYQKHRERFGHEPVAEQEIVRQTALIRKGLGKTAV